MSKTIRTHTAICVDRSGSMGEGDSKVEAEGGVRGFLDTLKALPDIEQTVCLYQFDYQFEQVYGPVEPAEAPAYELDPRGSTALYDAVGRTLAETRQVIRNLDAVGKAPDKVAIVIATDGKENSSREYNFNAQKKAIADAKELGWEIVFLAGTPKAVDYGRASGLRTTNYDTRRVGQTNAAYGASAQSVADYYVGETTAVETPESVEDKE